MECIICFCREKNKLLKVCALRGYFYLCGKYGLKEESEKAELIKNGGSVKAKYRINISKKGRGKDCDVGDMQSEEMP